VDIQQLLVELKFQYPKWHQMKGEQRHHEQTLHSI
jgi:hypothetical protein